MWVSDGLKIVQLYFKCGVSTINTDKNEMKKYTAFLIILIAMTLRLSAQIPNGGFENWETVPTVYAPYTGGSCENPTGWVSSNSYSAGSFFAITKSTDHYPDSVGSYSIRIENDTTLSNNATLLGGVPVQSYSGRGFVSTGTPPPSPNFAISGHPTSVTGYYKYAPLNGDVMLIYVTLFKNGTAVTTGELELGAAAASSSWTSFTIPLSYAVADSASILLAAYRSASTSDLPLGNSVLYVDNIDFGAFITPSTNAVTIDTSAHIAVISNTTWTAASDQSWILVSPDTATTGNSTITLKATANPTTAIRTATVTVSATGATSQTITVTQAAAAPVTTLSVTSANVAATDGSTAIVTVIANTTWSASSSDSWLTVSQSATSGNGIITLTATSNPINVVRIATVTITNASGSQTITVMQAAGTGTGFATVGEDDFALYPNPATSSFSINTQSLTKVQIYTVSGTLVLSKQVNGKESISTNNLTKGMYVVKIITDNAVMTKTLIVE